MYFFIDIPILFFRKNLRFVYLLESPLRGHSGKHTKHMIHNINCSKVSVIHALEGPHQVSLQQQIRFNSKIFGNKQCCYNEGPLYLPSTKSSALQMTLPTSLVASATYFPSCSGRTSIIRSDESPSSPYSIVNLEKTILVF